MNKSKAHLFISGNVQGVFFRSFTREVATGLGLNGWVKNLYDGRVEAVFEGTREGIEQAINECRKGSSGSDVKDIEVIWEASAPEYDSFEIKYF
ncbi:MAG: acylphosphatase [Nitrospirota bacterium]|nr:acylphosphatase [Nitrospirota bacterium]